MPATACWAPEMSDEHIIHQINTNLIGSIQVARAALPHLRAQRGGRIIQISMMSGQVIFPGGVLYHTSKWGIEGFMDGPAKAVGVLDIKVTFIEPAWGPSRSRGHAGSWSRSAAVPGVAGTAKAGSEIRAAHGRAGA